MIQRVPSMKALVTNRTTNKVKLIFRAWKLKQMWPLLSCSHKMTALLKVQILLKIRYYRNRTQQNPMLVRVRLIILRCRTTNKRKLVHSVRWLSRLLRHSWHIMTLAWHVMSSPIITSIWEDLVATASRCNLMITCHWFWSTISVTVSMLLRQDFSRKVA